MTTTIVLASSDDGYIRTEDADYNATVNGASPTAVTGGTTGYYGLGRNGANYRAHQTYLTFAYSIPSNELVTAATFGIRHAEHTFGAPVDMHIYTRAWGGTLDASDWLNPLGALLETRCAVVVSADLSGTTQDLFAGSENLVDLLRTGSSPFRFVVASNRQLTYDVNPTVNEYHGFWLSESSLDPALVVSSTPRSTLHGVMGAQVQLSDGTWCVLESDGATTPTVTLKHVNTSGTATTIATIPTGETAEHVAVQPGFGAQQLAMCVDASDNLYVVGREGTTENNAAVRPFIKGVGYSWTPNTTVVAAFGSQSYSLNNFAAAWHSAGDTLVIFGTRTSSDGVHGLTGYEGAWHIMSAANVRTATYPILRASGTMIGQFTPTVSPYVWSTPANDTGSGMDAAALSATKGALHTWSRLSELGDNQQTTKARYILNGSGTAFDSVYTETPTSGSTATWGHKTGASKLRVLPISSDTFATVSNDDDPTWGLTVAVYRNSGAASSFTLLGRIRLDNESITTMPSSATLSESHAWDAFYVTGANKIWVYYFDTANGRRLMRTAVSLNTYTATRDEVEVNATVGASGSTNLALRVARGAGTPRRTLVTVANRTSGGVHSTIYAVDTPNEAPTAPTLTARSNFDASASASFAWTFNDPDIGDTQTSFEIDINSASGVDYYDSGRLGAGISYVGASAAAVGNNASVQPAMPPGISAGDLLVIEASIRNSGTGTVNVPTKWAPLAVAGNFAFLGRIALSGAASADNNPTVTFAGGVANATTMARMFAWRGTDQNIATVVAASAAQLNGASATVVPYPAVSPGTSGCVVIVGGWRQGAGTSIAQLAGMTEIADDSTTTGDDAWQFADYVIQSASAAVPAGSATVTGGTSVISRAVALALRPHQSPTSSSYTLPASTLTQPGSWQWRVRTWDEAASAGAWSSYSTFSSGVGGTVTITDPVADNPANFIVNSYPVAWSLTGAVQADYRVTVKRTDTEATVYDSGWVTSTDTTHTVTGLLSDVEQRIEVTTRTSLAVESQTGTRLVTPDYDSPDDPELTVTEMPDDGHTLLAVNNPGPTGSKPAVLYNQLRRRATTGIDAGEDWVTVGAAVEDGSWKDYTAAGGITYEYSARAISADDTYSDSDTEEAALELQGVWIHDPADPANADDSAHQFPHGWTGKGLTINTMGEGTHYAGRTHPVVDYGEHETEELSVPLQLAHGDTWVDDLAAIQTFARAKKTLCVRDARGRRIFGTITYAESDEAWGTSVSVSVTRVDYDETYTTIPS